LIAASYGSSSYDYFLSVSPGDGAACEVNEVSVNVKEVVLWIESKIVRPRAAFDEISIYCNGVAR
jgi:hypothetical protein